MINYQTREKLKAGPLAPVYACLRRVKRSLRPSVESGVFPTAESVTRPDLAALRRAASERPGEPRLHFSLGLAYLEQGNSEQALRAFEACAALPFEAQERLALHTARALSGLGRGAEALACIEAVTDRDLTAEEAVLRDQVRAAAAREDTDHAAR